MSNRNTTTDLDIKTLVSSTFERRRPHAALFSDMDAYITENGVQKFRNADLVDAVYNTLHDGLLKNCQINELETDFIMELEDVSGTFCGRANMSARKIHLGIIDGAGRISPIEPAAITPGSKEAIFVWRMLLEMETEDPNSTVYTYLRLINAQTGGTAAENDVIKKCLYEISYLFKDLMTSGNGKYAGYVMQDLEEEQLIVPGIEDGKFQHFSQSAASFEENMAYLPGESIITEENEGLIPSLAGRVVTPYIKEMLDRIKYTGSRNFGLFGESGTGKSTAASILAGILKLPYRHLSCAEGIKATDLLVKIMPKKEDGGNGAGPDTQAPSFQEIYENPNFAMLSFLGTIPEKAAEIAALKIPEEERKNKLRELAFREIMEKSNHKEGEFVVVDSDLIKSIEEGGVCELQEVTLIKSPAILPVLNSLLDDCRAVVTMDGRRIVRHPNSIIVMTGNIGYAGCKELNESIKDRLDGIWILPSLSEEEMTERFLSEFPDLTDHRDILRRMAAAVLQAKKYCVNNRIRGFTCGYRAYRDWGMALRIPAGPSDNREKHVLKQVRTSVLSKCSLDPIIQRDILQSAIGITFSDTDWLLRHWR